VLSGLGALVAVMLVNRLPGAGGGDGRPLEVRLDQAGPYLVLTTEGAAARYDGVLAEVRKLHPGAREATFPADDLAAARRVLEEVRPRYALVLILPGELDVNFAWRWLETVTALDDDPFVDVRTGFITGDSPAAAAAFAKRIREAAGGGLRLNAAFVDNLGPNTAAGANDFFKMPGSAMIPVLGRRMAVSTVSHAPRAFTGERIHSMDGAGLVHFGGHGYPDRVVDCLNGPFLRRARLSPCVIFSGACYTGVTGRWFEIQNGRVAEQHVAPQHSFCLGALANNAVGYLAALHPDHGVPVYQEMEYLAWSGAALGEVMKHTHDGVILGAGGRLPALPDLRAGAPATGQTPAEIMLHGTAARVLFGDPALAVCSAFTGLPFETAVTAGPDGGLTVRATLRNPELLTTFADTYHDDLAWQKNGFNDRALISCELPAGVDKVSAVELVRAVAGGRELSGRVIGFGVEEDAGRRLLHVQVDLPSTAYMRSDFRRAGATVELRAGAVD
jgi:hypothetical protein